MGSGSSRAGRYAPQTGIGRQGRVPGPATALRGHLQVNDENSEEGRPRERRLARRESAARDDGDCAAPPKAPSLPAASSQRRRKDRENAEVPAGPTPAFQRRSASRDARDSASSCSGSRPQQALKARDAPLVPASAAPAAHHAPPTTPSPCPSLPLPSSQHPKGTTDQTACSGDLETLNSNAPSAPRPGEGGQGPPRTLRIPPSIRRRYLQFCAAKELAYRPLDSAMDCLHMPGTEAAASPAAARTPVDSQGAGVSQSRQGMKAPLPLDLSQDEPEGPQWSFPSARVDPADLHAPRPPRKRGVTVRWLEQFSRHCCEHFRGADFTASDVMLELVDPARELHGCPVAYLPNVEIADPDAMLLIAWDRPFLECVDAARQRFRGSPDSAVWMELFALDDSMGPLQQVNALPGIVAHVPHVMGAVDPAGSLFSEPWFLLSAFHAGKAAKLQLLTGSVAPGDASDVAGAIALASLSGSMATGASSRLLLTGALLQQQQQQQRDEPDRMGGALPAAAKVDRALPGMLLAAMGSLEPFYSASISRNLRPPCSLEVSAAAEVRVAILREAGDADRAEELLEKIVSMRARKLGDTHELVARSLTDLANIVRDKGQHPRAEDIYARALRAVRGRGRAMTAPGLGLAEMLFTQGKYEAARPLLERILSQLKGDLPQHDPAVLLATRWLGEIRKALGDYGGARELLTEARGASEKELGPRHPETAALVESLAGVAAAQGRHSEAADKYGCVAAALEEEDGRQQQQQQQQEGPHGLSRVLGSLAGAHWAAGNLEQSEAAFLRALGILSRQGAPQRDLDEAARLKGSLGALLREQGKISAAEALMGSSALTAADSDAADGPWQMSTWAGYPLEGPESELPELPHDSEARILRASAEGAEARSDHASAEESYRELLALARAAFGSRHLAVAAVASKLAEVLHKRMKFAEAKQLYRSAVAVRDARLSFGHPDAAAALEGLCGALEALEQHEEAAVALKRLLVLLSSGGSSPGSLGVGGKGGKALSAAACHIKIRLGAALSGQEKHVEAVLSYTQALMDQELQLPALDPSITASRDRLAEALIRAGTPKAAEAQYLQALHDRKTTLGPSHPDTIATMVRLGRLLLLLGNHSEAEAVSRGALEAAEQHHPGGMHVVSCLRALSDVEGGSEEGQRMLWRASVLENALVRAAEEPLAKALAAANSAWDPEVAEGHYRSALAVLEASVGPDPLCPCLLEPLSGLVSALEAQGRSEDAQRPLGRLSGLKEALEGRAWLWDETNEDFMMATAGTQWSPLTVGRSGLVELERHPTSGVMVPTVSSVAGSTIAGIRELGTAGAPWRDEEDAVWVLPGEDGEDQDYATQTSGIEVPTIRSVAGSTVSGAGTLLKLGGTAGPVTWRPSMMLPETAAAPAAFFGGGAAAASGAAGAFYASAEDTGTIAGASEIWRMQGDFDCEGLQDTTYCLEIMTDGFGLESSFAGGSTMSSPWQQRHRAAVLPEAEDSVVSGLPAEESADAAASLRRIEEELRVFNERESHVELMSALERMAELHVTMSGEQLQTAHGLCHRAAEAIHATSGPVHLAASLRSTIASMMKTRVTGDQAVVALSTVKKNKTITEAPGSSHRAHQAPPADCSAVQDPAAAAETRQHQHPWLPKAPGPHAPQQQQQQQPPRIRQGLSGLLLEGGAPLGSCLEVPGNPSLSTHTQQPHRRRSLDPLRISSPQMGGSGRDTANAAPIREGRNNSSPAAHHQQQSQASPGHHHQGAVVSTPAAGTFKQQHPQQHQRQQQRQQQRQHQAPKHDLAPVKPPSGSAMRRSSLESSAHCNGGGPPADGNSRSRAPCRHNAAAAGAALLKPPPRVMNRGRRASESFCSDSTAASVMSSSSLTPSSQGLRQRPSGEPGRDGQQQQQPAWSPTPPMPPNSSNGSSSSYTRLSGESWLGHRRLSGTSGDDKVAVQRQGGAAGEAIRAGGIPPPSGIRGRDDERSLRSVNSSSSASVSSSAAKKSLKPTAISEHSARHQLDSMVPLRLLARRYSST